ncbi:MAG: four helix bundle protein [Chitinophagales bacterium]|nr:four helix bundle protein [Chitinophagales bacterium]
MINEQNGKREYDLEERTFKFAMDVRNFIRKLPKTITNREDVGQLTRCSGSVAANYIEANEALSRKDFSYRIKVCRKEAKESRLFLRLVFVGDKTELLEERENLCDEAMQLVKIFNKIIGTTKSVTIS